MTAVFGEVIVGISYHSCGVLRYGDITVVLFCAVIICMAFFGTVISLLCYLLRLLFGTFITLVAFFSMVISLRCYSVRLLFSTVIPYAAFFSRMI